MRRIGVALHPRRFRRLESALPRVALVPLLGDGGGPTLPLDGLIVDPWAADRLDVERILVLRRRFSDVPALVYTELAPGVAPALLALGRAGLSRVVLERIDDSPAALREAVDDLRREEARSDALKVLADALGPLPTPLERALEAMQGVPAAEQSVARLARGAGAHRRALERCCASSDLPTPSQMLALLRIVEAYELLRGTRELVATVSQRLGFRTIRTLQDQSRAAFGCTVSGLRRLEPEEFAERLQSNRPSLRGEPQEVAATGPIYVRPVVAIAGAPAALAAEERGWTLVTSKEAHDTPVGGRDRERIARRTPLLVARVAQAGAGGGGRPAAGRPRGAA